MNTQPILASSSGDFYAHSRKRLESATPTISYTINPRQQSNVWGGHFSKLVHGLHLLRLGLLRFRPVKVDRICGCPTTSWGNFCLKLYFVAVETPVDSFNFLRLLTSPDRTYRISEEKFQYESSGISVSIEPDLFLCWDIDGTLLTTGRAGVFSLGLATREITGTELDLSEFPTAGLTDVEIARLIISRAGMEAVDEVVEAFLRIYEQDLPASLPRKKGKVMPGVISILENFRSEGALSSILLTGNTRAGARAKLEYYRLASFFDQGAFSDGTLNRAEIANNALKLIRSQWPGYQETRVVVVGDTRHDVQCARAIGAKVIGVGTGGATVSELQNAGADAVVEVLPEPAEFKQLLTAVCGV